MNNPGLWTVRYISSSVEIFFKSVDTLFTYASLLSAAFISWERFYATYRPFSYRKLSMSTYCIIIFTFWILATLVSTIYIKLTYLASVKHYIMYASVIFFFSLTMIICQCNIGIWGKFRNGRVGSQQQNRDPRSKSFTNTLLFVSGLTLICWLPLNICNFF